LDEPPLRGEPRRCARDRVADIGQWQAEALRGGGRRDETTHAEKEHERREHAR
jgi:hypothetical protein